MNKSILIKTLAVVGLSASIGWAQAGAIDALKQFNNDADGISGTFSQTVTSKKKKQTSSGSFQILRPGLFKWEYNKPYQQTIVGDGKTTLADLAKHAGAISTVSKADILAVLESTFSKIADDVADGKIVYVGEYFTLQAGGSSTGEENEKDVTASNIKSVKAVFRPGKMIKDALKLASFQKKA